MSDIRIDDDGFLVGDNDPANPSPDTQNTAENALLKAVQEGNRAIVSILRETQGLQRDTLKATQEAKKRTRTVRATPPIVPPSPAPRVNLVHPNRPPIVPVVPAPRVNLVHPNRPQPTPPIVPPVVVPPLDTARLNPDRANEAPNAPNSEPSQDANNNKNAAERSATSRITDGLKDLNNTLTVNANTDRIDPMVDAIKEAGSVITTGIDAGKKVLSVGNTLIAKPAMALGRGIKGLIKPKTDTINSPVAWYKRIWRTLERGNRQDQTQHNQEQRRLDELVRGQGQGGGSGNSGLLMLGLVLATLLAGIKSLFDNFKWPEFPKFEWPWGDGDKNNDGAPVVKGVPKNGLPPPRANPNHPNRPPIIPNTEPTKFQKAVSWLKNTKAVKFVQKAMTPLAIGTEVYAGGQNALDIHGDKNLTAEQKSFEQKKNATRTVARIGGSLGGAAAGAKAGVVLATPTANPFIIGAAGITGGILGSIYGAEGAEKANDWLYGKKIQQSNTTTQKSKKFVEPSSYADRDSEARKLYDEHKAKLDVDGSGIITRDEMIKGGRPDLLGEPEKAQITQKGFTPEKAKSIKATSERLGINPNDLAQIMSFETGGSFDPAQKNLAGGSARGLIQFTPIAAKDLRTTVKALEAMTFDEQMVYVEKYLKGRGIGKNGKTSLPDIYDAVLGSGYKKGSKEYAANPVDTNENGVIEKGEAVNSKAFAPHRKKQFFAQVATVTPKAITTPKANTPTNSVPTMKAAPVTALPVPNVQSVQSVQAKEQPTRHNTTPTPIKVSMPKPLVGQNVSDRGIAHILTGGIGETV